jgi:hypothetical protein
MEGSSSKKWRGREAERLHRRDREQGKRDRKCGHTNFWILTVDLHSKSRIGAPPPSALCRPASSSGGCLFQALPTSWRCIGSSGWGGHEHHALTHSRRMEIHRLQRRLIAGTAAPRMEPVEPAVARRCAANRLRILMGQRLALRKSVQPTLRPMTRRPRRAHLPSCGGHGWRQKQQANKKYKGETRPGRAVRAWPSRSAM